MNFEKLLKRFGRTPVIETENLRIGTSNRAPIHVQLSRWRQSGKITQLRRGIYVLADPYRKVELFDFHLAAVIEKPSYVSLEKALEYHDLIPEGVGVFTSVTTKRPHKFTTPLGVFDYRHVQPSLFWGYDSVIVNRQTAFVAKPEKALLDMFYLKALSASPAFIEELRLQNLGKISLRRLSAYAEAFGKPKIRQAARLIEKHVRFRLKEEKKL